MAFKTVIGRTRDEKLRYKGKGLIRIGRQYVQMGQVSSLTNKVYLDVATTHVILVTGKRGSGKSTTLSIIAEEISRLDEAIKQRLSVVMFDTLGVFWTMKYPNYRQQDLLDKWKIKPEATKLEIFVPTGHFQNFLDKGMLVDKKFSIRVSDLKAVDWCTIFNLDFLSQEGILIQNTLRDVSKKLRLYGLKDIIEELKSVKTDEKIKQSVLNLFIIALNWGLFRKKGTKLKSIVHPGRISVIDLSPYTSISGGFSIKALVVALISRKLLSKRMEVRRFEELQDIQASFLTSQKQELPLVWLMIDECLVGDTTISTNKGPMLMKDIVEKFEEGEKINVTGFNKETDESSYYPITKVYKKGKRKVIKLITETGDKIVCTPEHKILTSIGFTQAKESLEICLPLISPYTEDQECIKARLLGHLFGDGWASDRMQTLGFSGKRYPQDLNKIKHDLWLLGYPSSNIHSRKTISRITHRIHGSFKVIGTSHSIGASVRAYRFFKDLGVICGPKVLSESQIPQWIKNARPAVKSEFLAALIGSDGSRLSPSKKASGEFNAIRLSFHKLESLKPNAIQFSEELRSLFKDLGIELGKIYIKNANIRKDGNKTISIVLTIKKNISNMIIFLEKIGYRYCSDKEKEGKKWLFYLKSRYFLKKERETLYNKSLILRKKGLTCSKIARILNVKTFHVKGWVSLKHASGLPKGYPQFNDWIKDRVRGNTLRLKIHQIRNCSEEEVFDISVDQVHNFIANGFIVHNCHEFIPKNGKTIATDPLIQILREGRQPGISLIGATQQPGEVHNDMLTQADVVISHRLTAESDIKALSSIMQSYLLSNIETSMRNLPKYKGAALILDDSSERIYTVKIRPKRSWHGGEAPTAVKIEKEIKI